MGKKSRYNLPEARKGLYGTSTISSNSYYLDGHNWLMAIKIKDECLVPERVTSFFDLSKNKQFLDWFSLKYTNMNFESFEKTCPLDKIRKDLFSNEFCNQVANEYLVENNIAIVHDHVLNSSFYIRDRNCIESISGSAEQIIEMLANDKSHFETNCLGVSNVSSLPVLIYDALKSSKKTYSWSQLWKLKSNINYLKKNNYEDVTDEMMNTQYDYFVVGNYLRFKLLSYPFNIKNYRQ